MKTILMTREDALGVIGAEVLAQVNCQVMVLGMRGFLAGSEGNKRGIYDDAIVLITPEDCLAYNANTDPSVTRKGVAVLQDGVYWHKRGLHGVSHLNLGIPGDRAIMDQLLRTNADVKPIPGKLIPYYALRQASPVTVKRDGSEDLETIEEPNGWPWIDIHRGGYNTTSSLGCQTIYPDQWEAFRDNVFGAMVKHDQPRVPYILVTKNS